MGPPVRGKEIDDELINKSLKVFAPILIKKIEELNSRARVISVYTLLSLFKHPDADILALIDACLDIC